MKTISFFFELKPLSVNAAYQTLKSGHRAKSVKYLQYSQIIKRKIDTMELADFATTFDETKHGIKMNLIVYLKDFYTKKGAISKISLDVANCEKPLIDTIFKHAGLPDSHITEIYITKNKGERDCFFLNLEIIPK